MKTNTTLTLIKTMTKQDLIKAITEEARKTRFINQADVEAVINTLPEVVAHNLARGHNVTLHGLCVFKPGEVKAREYRNPRTGVTIIRGAHPTVKAKASARLIGAMVAKAARTA